MFDAKVVHVEDDMLAEYAFSQGFKVGDFIYLSGQVAVDDDHKIVGEGDFEAQARQVYSRIEALLNQEGSGLPRVFKTTSYLTDMANLSKLVEVRKEFFRPPFPADTTVEVKGLAAPRLMLEVEVIALIEGRRR